MSTDTRNMSDGGGPAYPVSWSMDGETVAVPGMTLRDYFAGQALANRYTDDERSAGKVAEWAYQVADAMLEERNR